MQVSRSAARLSALVAGAVLAAGLLSACASTKDPPDTDPTPSPSSARSTVTFVVYGASPVIAAYTKIAAGYTAAHPQTVIKVEPYATHDQALAAVDAATAKGDPPDLFQIDSQDMPALVADKALRRVDDLLSAREVDFGDGYSRSGLEAFSADAALQCMPTDVSPLVVYYNTRLIDLTAAAEPGTKPVTQDSGWTVDEFTRVAQLAQRPGVRGFYVAPDVDQVVPLIESGGAKVVDNPEQPTTTTLSDTSSLAVLDSLLPVLRNPALTYSRTALAKSGPVARFKAGQLGMLLGFRDLTAVLRTQPGLNFDVMPLPHLSTATTVASETGLCISAKSDQVQKAADFLTDIVSTKSAQELAATGYVMPTNVDVVNDDSFLQRGQRPLHAEVFQRELRHAVPLPTTAYWPAVDKALDTTFTSLLYGSDSTSLPVRMAAFDEASRFLFNPNATPSPSPTPSSTPSSTPGKTSSPTPGSSSSP